MEDTPNIMTIPQELLTNEILPFLESDVLGEATLLSLHLANRRFNRLIALEKGVSTRILFLSACDKSSRKGLALLHDCGFRGRAVEMWDIAAKRGDVAVMEALWAAEYAISENALTLCARLGNFSAAKFLFELGQPITEQVCHAAVTNLLFDEEHRNVSLVRWLRDAQSDHLVLDHAWAVASDEGFFTGASSGLERD